MVEIDEAILNCCNIISKNIAIGENYGRGLIAQNVLSQLRNLVEYVAQKVYSSDLDLDCNPESYEEKQMALSYIKKKGEFRFLQKFYDLLQKTVSHFSFDEGGSERLMLKYYKNLSDIRDFLKEKYHLDVLANLEDFPLNEDSGYVEYCQKLAACVDSISCNSDVSRKSERVYIWKIKPFVVNHSVYYEIAFTEASDKSSKFDRIVAFTRKKIADNYAVKLKIRYESIEVLGVSMPILVVDDWEVSIRQCEMEKLAKIFGLNNKISLRDKPAYTVMHTLKDKNYSLLDFVLLPSGEYEAIKSNCGVGSHSSSIFVLLDLCRELIINDKPGCNVVRYLLHRVNNKILKLQCDDQPCVWLSNLYLRYGCIPFDRMPYATSLLKHNPGIYDLLDCISPSGREHELLARKINNNTEQRGMLFTPEKDLAYFSDINALINNFYRKLYYRHRTRRMMRHNNHIYIEEAANYTERIITHLKGLAEKGIISYRKYAEKFLSENPCCIDSDEKREIFKRFFEHSRGVLVYGAAGTGKTTLIKHISCLFSNCKKIYLANTHSAVDNLRRKVQLANCEFRTIADYLRCDVKECDILFIDECSTVGNKDMSRILTESKYTAVIMTGDVYQIESIKFGNWFNIARYYMPETSSFELTNVYRTESSSLLDLWKKVRKLEGDILEVMVRQKYSTLLNETIFQRSSDDEIILCLSYNGFYGINNINRFLQTRNPQPEFKWGIKTYKVGDPVLFDDTKRFGSMIHNNMKGIIKEITEEENRIKFDVEIDAVIIDVNIDSCDFILKDNPNPDKSTISFWVEKKMSTDEDDNSLKDIVPFQVAYAVSIHKAQGLEYESVKIVITEETVELISHNIFYTAITRAKQRLKIYWTPETEKAILERFYVRNYKKDSDLLKNLLGNRTVTSPPKP